MVSERTFIHPLPRWAHRRPITALMTCASMIVIGLFALYQLPIEFLPDSASPWMWLNVPYSNSTPEEVDKSIAKPLEEQLKLMRSIKRIIIRSSTSGCRVNIQFENGTDMDNAYLEARDAIDRARVDFPDDIGHIGLFRHKSDDIPVLWVGLALPTHTSEELYRLVNDRIKPTVERVPGVASVEVHGLMGENLYIDLDLDRLQSHGIDIYELFRDLSLANEDPSVGSLNDGGTQVLVRTLFRLKSVDEYRSLPVASGTLTLKDIASIAQRLPETDYISRINGQTGFSISVNKESTANTVEVAHNARAALEALTTQPELEGLNLTPFFDQSLMITSSLESLFTTGLWGAFFALIILYLFIRNLTTTFIVIVSVPLSILTAVATLYFGGFTLNMATMMGLMLAVGMLVDNAIVSTENIFRYRQTMQEHAKAAILGASQVGTAINASTLTTIIVFLPLFFATGEVGTWMRQVGFPISVSLIASLFIALSLVPLAITQIIRKPLVHRSRWIPKITGIYQRLMVLFLDHKLVTILGIFAILASSLIALRGIPSNTKSNMGMRQISIRIKPPENANLEQVEKIVIAFEKVILENKDKLDIANISSGISASQGHIQLFLKESGKNLLREEEAKNRVRDLLPKLPGVTWWFGWMGGDTGGGNNVDVTFTGNSPVTLRRLAEQAKPLLLASPNVVDVTTSDDSTTREIHFSINRELAQSNGISATEIAQTVGIALMGRTVSRFQTGEQEIDVRLQLSKQDREHLLNLLNLPVFSPGGHAVPLKTLVDYEIVPGPDTIVRVDGKVEYTIQIEMADSDMKTARETITKALAPMKFPSGHGWRLGQVFFDFDMNMKDLEQAFVLASILVLLLLGALFESLLHPFTIFFSLPFALVGAFWALRITGSELNIISNVGLIMLIGIVVNNAIVLVDHINQLRAAGMPRRDALLQAGEDRFRPIVMTASTTILGLFPMAFASSNFSSEIYSTLAITVMGGMITSTILTLLVLPLVYDLMDDFQLTIRKWLHSFQITDSSNEKI